MANAGGIRAGKVFVELFAEDSKLRKGLDRAQASLRSFSVKASKAGGVLTGLGGAALAPLLASAKKFADIGDSLDKMSQRTGIAASSLSELSFAAEQSGSDLKAVEDGIRAMSRGLNSAVNGAGEGAAALEKLGLSAEDLLKLSPEQQFLEIGTALNGIESETVRAATAMQLFGDSGTKLLPFFASGADGIEAMRQEARELGLVLSDDDANAAATLTDAFSRMTKAAKGIALQFGASIAPTAAKVADAIALAASRVSQFVAKHQGLVKAAAAIALGIAGAGSALLTIAGGAALAATALSGLSTILGGVGAAVALLVSPVGLVTAAVVAGSGALLYYSGLGKEIVESLGGAFSRLKDSVLPALKAIGDALMQGDFAKAAKIGFGTLKLVFLEVTRDLRAYWSGFTAALSERFIDIVFTMRGAWHTFSGAIVDMFDRAVTSIKNLFADLADTVQNNTALKAAMAVVAPAAALALDNSPVGSREDNDAALKERQAARDKSRESEKALFKDIKSEISAGLDRSIAGIDRQIDEARRNLNAAVEETTPRAVAAEGTTANEPAAKTTNPFAAGAKFLGGFASDLASGKIKAMDLIPDRIEEAIANAKEGKFDSAGLLPEFVEKGFQAASDAWSMSGVKEARETGIAELNATSKGTFSAFSSRAFATGDDIPNKQLTALQKIEKNTKAKPAAVKG